MNSASSAVAFLLHFSLALGANADVATAAFAGAVALFVTRRVFALANDGFSAPVRRSA